MRASATGDYLRVRAITGTHVVVLAWDFVTPPNLATLVAEQNLLGFAVQRKQFDAAGQVRTRYYLRGLKRFADKDKGLPPGTRVPTSEHPIQSFLWADYTATAEGDYEYAVQPVFGEPQNLRVDEALGVAVRVRCESTTAPGTGVRHDVHFNRGVIGSQAYAREFDNVAPDPEAPQSKPMRWLSRGLYEALLAFIERGARPGMGLRAAFYEFHYLPVAQALSDAAQEGDVQVVYDAASKYKAENQATIAQAGLAAHAHPRTVSEGIRHNKFIVLLEHGQPVSVWTGSTNISAGGIFGHSNVGHVVHDPEIARQYLDYWTRLQRNLTPGKLRTPNAQASPLPALPLQPGTYPVFSPREDNDEPQARKTLQWYANLASAASQLVCFTAAFEIAAEFQAVFQAQNDVLRYVIKDDPLKETENIGTDGDVIFAAGSYLSEDNTLSNALKERDNPLNSNDYIHTKYMLVDPLGEQPTVVTGSANFSSASQVKNDENMLVIHGDTRVADIYFGEFMRLFDHHYARYLAARYQARPGSQGNYLKETAGQWLPAHLDPSNYRSKRRQYFIG
jgi:phosphatidylserine/phosphatidylglycerophosphate/cardiolipin synthase-like enzyme